MGSFKIMEYASSEWVQMLNFPWLFINHFCSISKITFSAKFELPDTSKIFLKLTTVFSFEIWLIFKNFFSSCGRVSAFSSGLFSNYSRTNLEQTVSLQIIHKCECLHNVAVHNRSPTLAQETVKWQSNKQLHPTWTHDMWKDWPQSHHIDEIPKRYWRCSPFGRSNTSGHTYMAIRILISGTVLQYQAFWALCRAILFRRAWNKKSVFFMKFLSSKFLQVPA